MPPINELDGFEVFIPSHDPNSSRIQLTISKTGCRLSKAALSHIKYPEFVNVFFDRSQKRMMITAADKRNQNIMKLSKQGNCPNTLCQKCFMEELMTIGGLSWTEKLRIAGYKAKSSQPALIFNLLETVKQ